MAGRTDCCRYEATLDELIDDEVMAPVLRSAGLDPQRFRDLIVETARRFDERAADSRAGPAPASRGTTAAQRSRAPARIAGYRSAPRAREVGLRDDCRPA